MGEVESCYPGGCYPRAWLKSGPATGGMEFLHLPILLKYGTGNETRACKSQITLRET